jgi:cell division protein FtsB
LARSPKVSPRRFVDCDFQGNPAPATIVSTQQTCFEDDEEMVDPALLAQLQQLACQLSALQQKIGNLQASNTTLTTKVATLEAQNNTLTIANTTLTAQVANLSGGSAASGTA